MAYDKFIAPCPKTVAFFLHSLTKNINHFATKYDNHLIAHGRSQNLKEVPQNIMKVFNVETSQLSEVIQKNQHC